MKLQFTPRAAENIAAIGDYVRAHNPDAARRVRAAIYESLQDLILFPHVGRLQQTEGVRKFITRKYAYLVYYKVDDAAEEVIVLNVKHPAQRREHEDR
jgi:plasmid stabilization system protein ParE